MVTYLRINDDINSLGAPVEATHAPALTPPAGGRRRKRLAGGIKINPRARHGRRRAAASTGRADDARAGARAAAGPPLDHGPVRLRRGPRELLDDVLLPVRHLRAGGGDRGPRLPLQRGERGALRAHRDGHVLVVPARLHLLLPHQDARPVRPPGGPLPGPLRPLLLRVLRPLPGVPRAPQPRLRHGHRMARQHGAAAARRRGGDRAARHARRRDDAVIVIGRCKS